MTLGHYAPDGSTRVTLTDGGGSAAGAGGATTTIGSVEGTQVTYTDKSGTVTSGGAAQTIAASNSSRTGFLIQNQSTGDLWIRDGATAAATQPSVLLPAGSYYEYPSTGVPTTLISLFGATTGQAFAAREW